MGQVLMGFHIRLREMAGDLTHRIVSASIASLSGLCSLGRTGRLE